MDWTKRALELCGEYQMLPRGGTVLCAVSGGADSMCLLHWLNHLRLVRPFTLAVAHYNHRLRGEESDRDEAFVRSFVEQWCGEARVSSPGGERTLPPVAFFSGSGDVAGEAKRRGRGIEETAREMRYAFLQRTAEDIGAAVIATAHNANDNAETALLHLIRGSGLRGLAGIPPRRGNIVRPLLTTTRREIEEYLRLYAVPHVEDSTNFDDTYSRNRLRHRLLPELEEIDPRFVERMAATLRRLREDEDFLTARAELLRPHFRQTGEGLAVEAARLGELPDPIAARAARLMLSEMGQTHHTAAHLEGMVALCRGDDPSATLPLPGGLTARRVYGDLLLTRREPTSFTPIPLAEGMNRPEGSLWAVECKSCICPTIESAAHHFYLAKARCGSLTIRPRQVGDRLTLPHREGSRTVKKYFIDQRIPRWERERIPLLADEEGVAAVAGLGPDRGRLARPGENAWEITLTKIEKDDDGHDEQ